jgi:hypothetical protein
MWLSLHRSWKCDLFLFTFYIMHLSTLHIRYFHTQTNIRKRAHAAFTAPFGFIFVFLRQNLVCSSGSLDPPASSSQVLHHHASLSVSFLFCFVVMGFELRAYILSHSTSPFLGCVFLRWGLMNCLQTGFQLGSS